jgi:hypothetical protein
VHLHEGQTRPVFLCHGAHIRRASRLIQYAAAKGGFSGLTLCPRLSRSAL